MSEKCQSCSIFFYDGYVGIAPTIINLSKSLERQNYFVTIYGTKNNFPNPGRLGEKIETIYFTKGTRLFSWLKQIKLQGLVPWIELLFYIFPALWHQLKSHNNSKFNIAVDIYGAITGLLFFYLFKQNFLFLSLELWEPDRFKGMAKPLSKLAKLACRKSEGILIQDQDRWLTFCQYYDYQHPHHFYLPNSSLAEDDSESNSNVSDSNYFRQKFKLNSTQFSVIVLQAGMIADAVFSKVLAKTFNAIDSGYALVFHERKQRKEDPYIQALREINSKNLFLSLDPVSYEDIGKIYHSADIGLAFYQDLGNNFAQISMASGKISHYLKYGKPVLVNNLPSLCKLVEQYQIGVVIHDPYDAKEIKVAIEQIMQDYSKYSRQAKICFEKEFDFGKKMESILSFMENFSEIATKEVL